MVAITFPKLIRILNESQSSKLINIENMFWTIGRSSRSIYRTFTTNPVIASQPPISRPGPPPLPRKDQKEFEELVKTAARPAAASSPTLAVSDNTDDQLHPDARRSPPPEFMGDVNPVTGERGGPKREPVKHGDWSYSGRVTDF